MLPPNGKIGFLRMPVFPFTTGQVYDEKILMLVSGLRPNRIRVVEAQNISEGRAERGSWDYEVWDVEIAVGAGQRVMSISQIMEIKLCDGYETTHPLAEWLLTNMVGALAAIAYESELEAEPEPEETEE